MRWRQRNAILSGLEVARRAYPELSLMGLVVFLYVAENPGINIAELADVCGTTDATASRTARRLAGPEAGRPLPPSLGLLRFSNQPGDPRVRYLDLSESGEALRRRLDELIERAAPIRPWDAAATAPSAPAPF